MTSITQQTRAKPHFTFWIFAVCGLLWNLMGCLNYLVLTNPASVAMMPEALQEIVNARPAWVTAAFAMGVFCGSVGCFLLLLRHKTAVLFFAVSLLGIAGTTFYTLTQASFAPSTMMSVLMSGALFWYGTIAQRRHWLG